MSVGAALALLLGLAAPGQALGKTYVTHGSPDDRPVYKPKRFVAGSGVGGGVLKLRNVRWSSWRDSRATGRGTLLVNGCDPTCAEGTYEPFPAKITLTRPRRGCDIYVDGQTVTASERLFTHIRLDFNGLSFRSLTSGTQSCQ